MEKILPVTMSNDVEETVVCDECSDMHLRIGSQMWKCVSSVVSKIPLFEFLCSKGIDEDVFLLLHGGNMIGEGNIVYSKDLRYILPIKDYFHVLMLFCHGKEVELPNDLLWLVFFDNFLAMVYKKESSLDVGSFCGLHKRVLSKLCVLLSDPMVMSLWQREQRLSSVYHSQTPSLTSEQRQVSERPAFGSVILYPK